MCEIKKINFDSELFLIFKTEKILAFIFRMQKNYVVKTIIDKNRFKK